MEEVVSEAILRLRKRLPDIKIRVNMPNDFLMLSMDPTLIEQVLINLLENAYVHSGSHEPIDLTITGTPDHISFTVRDYGRGISEKQLPYIFEGQQTMSESTDGHKGIGIGLSICKTIIRAHDGEITAANHPTALNLLSFFQKKRRITTMPKCSVLIIEDEKNIQTFMGKVLKRHDYRVLYADTGRWAWR